MAVGRGPHEGEWATLVALFLLALLVLVLVLLVLLELQLLRSFRR